MSMHRMKNYLSVHVHSLLMLYAYKKVYHTYSRITIIRSLRSHE